MTNKTTMPEPVAYFYVNGSLEGVSRHKRSELALPDATEEHGLITTAQAEAYANARVKQALDEAAMILKANAEACNIDTAIMLRANAEAIRALIPTTEKPTSPTP